jgi:signal transduction histidine kinase
VAEPAGPPEAPTTAPALTLAARLTARLTARLGSVRVRTTLLTVFVVSVTVAAGGTGAVWLLQRSLTNGLIAADTAEAGSVAALLSARRVPPHLLARPGIALQVVDARGTVVAASDGLAGKPPVSAVRPGPGTRATLSTPGMLADDDENDVTVAETTATAAGPLTVYAVASAGGVRDSWHDAAVAFGAVLPLVVGVSGLLAWWLAGRALRPVEAIRSGVAGLSAGDLHRRVPEPPQDDEIGRLARTMNAMLARLEASRDQQNRFVSDASHELRTPLAALLAQVEVAASRPEQADWPAVAAAVGEEGARLGRIVDNLLLLARGDEGHLEPGRDLVDVDEIVLSEAQRVRARGRVAVDLRAVGAGRVLGDRDQLRSVVRNLADNAERFAAGTVSLAVRHEDGAVVFEVADDGPGIAPEDRERVFRRFTRLDEGRQRSTGGSGLGLAIVGEVVAAHGGTATVEDSPRGARMVVRLPAAP